MDLTTKPGPSKPVIFFIGVTGYHTLRRLIPAFYDSFLKKWMLVFFSQLRKIRDMPPINLHCGKGDFSLHRRD